MVAPAYSVSGFENQLISVNNRWRGPGQVTTMPKATWGDPMGNSRFSDRWIEDGSYIRLRSISLQYSVPVKETAVLRNLTIYATATNLFTLTKYKGYDPEINTTYTGNLNLGHDFYTPPQARTISVGFNVGF